MSYYKIEGWESTGLRKMADRENVREREREREREEKKKRLLAVVGFEPTPSK